MVTLDTLLIASCISFGGGVLTTVGFGLLGALIRNTTAKEDDSQFAIPLSSLVNGPPSGGGINLMDAYRAAQAAHAGQGPPPPPETKKDDKVLSGTYL